MADVQAIRLGLAAALGTIPKLKVSPYVLSNPTPPCAYIFADDSDFDEAMGRGLDELVFVVRVVVPLSMDIGSQVNLDAYRAGSGARSFKQALEADDTLGGVCDSLRVTSISRDTVYVTEGNPPALGCEFRVEIHAPGRE